MSSYILQPCTCCNNTHNNVNDCCPAISYWSGSQSSINTNNNYAKLNPQDNLNNAINYKNWLQKNTENIIKRETQYFDNNFTCNK